MTHTHKSITYKFLRRALARELLDARKIKKDVTPEVFMWIRFSVEGGIWAVQKQLAAEILC